MLLDPTAEDVVAPIQLAPRTGALKGVVGLMDISKPKGSLVLEQLAAEHVRERISWRDASHVDELGKAMVGAEAYGAVQSEQEKLILDDLVRREREGVDGLLRRERERHRDA